MSIGQATIEELISVLVGETNEMDNEDETRPEQLRLVMRKHYTVGGLTDVLSVFGPVKEDFTTLGRIAKSRAVAIFRDLKSNASGGGATASASSAPAKPPENGASANAFYPTAMPQPRSQPQPIDSSSDQNTGNKNIPFDVINQAQKLCRYANSALEHEDINTAVKNCEEVLRLLRPYHD